MGGAHRDPAAAIAATGNAIASALESLRQYVARRLAGGPRRQIFGDGPEDVGAASLPRGVWLQNIQVGHGATTVPQRRSALMPEMPRAGEDHGKPGGVGGFDDIVVAHRAAWLDHRRRARFCRGEQAVGEGKERVRRDDRAFRQTIGKARRLRGLVRLLRGDAR